MSCGRRCSRDPPVRESDRLFWQCSHAQNRFCCDVTCMFMPPCPLGQNGLLISTVFFPAHVWAVRFVVHRHWTRSDRDRHSLPATPAVLTPLVVHLRVRALCGLNVLDGCKRRGPASILPQSKCLLPRPLCLRQIGESPLHRLRNALVPTKGPTAMPYTPDSAPINPLFEI